MQTYSKSLISLVSVRPCLCICARGRAHACWMCVYSQPSWLADYPQSIKIYLVIYNAKQACVVGSLGREMSGRLRT